MNLPFPTIRASDIPLQAQQSPWIIRDLWTREAVGIVGGPAKVCKSWVALDMAVSVASSTPCLGRFPVEEPGPCLIYMAEDALPAVRGRLHAISQQRFLDLSSLDLYAIDTPSLRLDLQEHQQRLHNTVGQIQPRMLLLDPLVRMHRSDENSAQEMSKLLGFLRELQRTFHLAVVLVHHTSKKHRAHPGQALRGSSDLHAWTDSSLYLQKNRNDLVLTVEHRSASAPQPMLLRLVSQQRGGAAHLQVLREWQPPHSQGDEPLTDSVAQLLAQSERPLTRDSIRRELRVKNQTLGQALNILEQSGRIRRVDQGWLPGLEHNPSPQLHASL